jgi:sugar/nucleoside kinase (ribokinase family)
VNRRGHRHRVPKSAYTNPGEVGNPAGRVAAGSRSKSGHTDPVDSRSDRPVRALLSATESADAVRTRAVDRPPAGRPSGTAGGLLVVGDVITDIVARHREALARGTDTTAAVRMMPGGAGANVACWAAYWGFPDVRLLGRVGAESADWHQRALIAAGVCGRLIIDSQAPTGTVICLVDAADGAERTFLTDSGASLRLAPTDWSPSTLDGIARLHLSGYLLFSAPGRALVRTAVAAARARGVPVSLDPASVGFLRELGVGRFVSLVDGVDILLPSRAEARLLTGLSDDADAAAHLSRTFPLVVAKQGADGALVAQDGALQARVPAVPAQPQDSTGAGDAFTGAFLACLLAGAKVARAAQEGCRAGALAAARTGGRPPALHKVAPAPTNQTSNPH